MERTVYVIFLLYILQASIFCSQDMLSLIQLSIQQSSMELSSELFSFSLQPVQTAFLRESHKCLLCSKLLPFACSEHGFLKFHSVV